jgi:uncharacterized membrane protein YphA (DoxX/SURF4 family)
MDHQLDTRVTVLRLAFGATATLAGLDKFFNILVDWSTYISPLAAQLLPFSPEAFMRVVGVIELGVGIAILGAAPVIGAYIASAWLMLIAANLVLSGHLDVAARDVVMSISAFTLARLLEQRQEAPEQAVSERSRRTAVV